jgi:hypothetical protein
MSIARILPCMLLVIALAAGAFMPAAHARASGVVRPGHTAGTSSKPTQVAELARKKHGKELAQRKHAKDRTKARNTQVAKRKNHRPDKVAREPSSNSILFRLAPYDYTLG